jgi:hypothetical protein
MAGIMMTNIQLWLAIGIPSLLIIASALLNLQGINKLDRRIDRLEDKQDTRMSKLEARMDSLLEHMTSMESGILKMLYDHVESIAKLEGSKST